MIAVCMGMVVSVMATAAVIVTARSERRKTWVEEGVEGENLEGGRVAFYMEREGLENHWCR